jgi:hypothetical protein
VRTRELRLWFGAALLTLGTVLVAVALAYFAKEPRFSLSRCWQMRSAEGAFLAAFLSFLYAIMGWRIPLWPQRFPNISVTVETVGSAPATYSAKFGLPTERTQFFIYPVHFVSREPERIASIKIARLYGKVTPGRAGGMVEQCFRPPKWRFDNSSLNLDPIKFPLNLEPEKSSGGDLVFDMQFWKTEMLAAPLQLRIEIEDASSGKRMSFPAEKGTYWKGHGLWPTSGEEWALKPAGRRARRAGTWNGLMAPPGP